jgi:hypothetical protein
MARELAEAEYDKFHRGRIRQEDRQPSDFDRSLDNKADELKKLAGPTKRRGKNEV